MANDFRVNRRVSYGTDIVAAKVLNPNQMKIRIHSSTRGKICASGNAAVAATAAFVNRFTPHKIEVICTGGKYTGYLSPRNNQVGIVGQAKLM